MKLTKCRIKADDCELLYTKWSISQKCCNNPLCALELVRLDKEKKQRKQYKEAKIKAKTSTDYANELQDLVNKYVRLRDSLCGCISCSKPYTWKGQWHASHFRSRGAASAIRFNLWNIHKSCSVCNNWKSGNLSEYEPRLREKIGDIKVDWLRTQNQVVKYDVDYLKRFIAIVKRKIKLKTKQLQGGNSGY